jgi:hemoglobin
MALGSFQNGRMDESETATALQNHIQQMSTPFSPHYEQIGGEAGIRTLVDRFYDLMDTAPEATAVRALHATNLKVSREKLFLYLSGWLGGPPLYEEKFGHPRLRMRHFPFAIGVRERDEWIWCMETALAQHDMPEALRTELVAKLRNVAWHMQNQPG